MAVTIFQEKNSSEAGKQFIFKPLSAFRATLLHEVCPESLFC